MSDKLAAYRQADRPLPDHNRLWPLYGAGFENLGRDGQAIQVPMPQYGPDELLVRHDACGLCFSDIKVIRAGPDHPRIYRDMQADPVVLGHEVSLTIAGVGKNLRSQYRIGDRFIMQADIFIDGVSYAYGYEIQGGLSQYSAIDWRVLNGDHGCYLVPVQPATGYAEAALTEPWACVEASYNVVYRTQWQDGGSVWIVGDGQGVQLGRAEDWRPRQAVLNVVDDELAAGIRTWAEGAGIQVSETDDDSPFDDIVVLDADAELIEQASARLAKGGILNIVSAAPLTRRVLVDVGRLHYDHQTIVGTPGPDLSAAYTRIRSQLQPGGRLWIVGAAGPMGHMHIQRALEMPGGPDKIVATNLRQPRIREVERKFAALALEQGIALVSLSQEPLGHAGLAARLWQETAGQGFDDIVVLAPSVSAIEKATAYLSNRGVMDVFAGLPRGTLAALDVDAVVRRGVRFTGSSGSSIEDLRQMRDLTESHVLSPNRSVAAVAGLEGAADGLCAVSEGRFPGKVVVFPNIGPLPLTPLQALEDALPSVYAKLGDGCEWTVEAENEFLRLMLA
jgi:D-arabinose 1-dehydrogenase-like Zn-dependent alcohol dehydrogenase